MRIRRHHPNLAQIVASMPDILTKTSRGRRVNLVTSTCKKRGPVPPAARRPTPLPTTPLPTTPIPAQPTPASVVKPVVPE